MNEIISFEDSRDSIKYQVTIVVCCYNQKEFIEELFNNIKCISKSISYEVIFIDDFSQDDSYEFVEKIKTNYNFSILTIKKKNSGLVRSLQLGLKESKGEIIFFIASDDLINPEDFSRSVIRLLNKEKINFVINNGLVFGNGIISKSVYQKEHDLFFSMKQREKVLPSSLPSPLLIQTTIFKRKFLIDIGGFDTDIILDDLPLFLKIFRLEPKVNYDFMFINDLFISSYRQHNNNNHKNLKRQYDIYKQVVLNKCDKLDQKNELAYLIGKYLISSLKKRDIKMLKYFYSEMKYNRIISKTFYSFTSIFLRKLI